MVALFPAFENRFKALVLIAPGFAAARLAKSTLLPT
jgi:hypothetical protein